MRMQALKTFQPQHLDPANRTVAHAGYEFETSDQLGRVYETRGLAIPVGEVGKQPVPAKEPRANKAAATGPLSAAGGRTGAETPSSSSRAAPARETHHSSKRGARRGR